jgi:EAL and modified HD-GYP domain-containing signal transduction protein
LDDFVPGSPAEALLPYARFVKVDVLALSEADRRAVANRLKSATLHLIAEKVETAEMRDAALAEGYSLFQGFYFCRPTTLTSEALPARRLAYLQLLGALTDRRLTIDRLEELVKRDASLSVRVLRSVNSAAFHLHQRLQSVRQALVLLGIEQIRKWASVWALAEMNDGGTPEIATTAVLRARCCEILGTELVGPAAGSGYFLLGLCSLLDAILRRPMEAAIADLPLQDDVRDALLGEPNLPRHVLEAVIAYESGHWDVAEPAAAALQLAADALPAAYRDALRWADATTKF